MLVLVGLAAATFRTDHAVSLQVRAPWYAVPVFEQLFFFVTDYSEALAVAFLRDVISERKVDDEAFLWAKVKSFLPDDALTLVRAQVELGYFLPRAELYRETARAYDGSNYRDLFAVGGDAALADCPNLSPAFSTFEFDLALNGESDVCVYANLHNETAAAFVLGLIERRAVFVLRPVPRTAQFGISLRGFGIGARPFKHSMEHGVKDSAVLNATAGSVGGADAVGLLRDVSGNSPLFMGEIAPDPDGAAVVRQYFRPGTSHSVLNRHARTFSVSCSSMV